MRLLTWLTDLLFPPRCVVCHCLLADKETDICAKCRRELPTTEQPIKRAGVPRCYSPYYYEEAVTASVRRFKFHGCSFYAEVYGRQIAMRLLQNAVVFDLLTWVPISKKRRRKRGYDQTLLLAQAVARELGTTALPLIRKLRDNPPQAMQPDAAARRGNVLGVYALTKDAPALKDKRVLLIDDVITTGATLSECVRVLSTAGAAGVVCATLAATRKKE